MDDCIFCKIIAGEIPGDTVYEDEQVYAFRDISPQAPVHILVIPKEHIAGMDEITPQNSAVVGHIAEVIARLARELGLRGGFRVVSNVGQNGCQSVRHLHFHLLGEKQMTGRMG